MDQLTRGNGLSGARLSAISADLRRAEGLRGGARQSVLSQLASQLDAEAGTAADARRVRLLAGVVRELSGVTTSSR